jgi:signal transduction histidine kinase
MLFDQLEQHPQLCASFRQHLGATALDAGRAALQLLATVRHKAINLNKLERGQSLQPERASCRVRELVHSVKSLTQFLPARREAVTCSWHVSTNVAACILTDGEWLLLILVNLLTNAFKNTKEGSVHLNIFAVSASMLRLQVSDTGQGVPPDMEDHLFAPYSQASKWRFGTGLGLYHVSQLASALGGAAQYARNHPQGATFWVDVPYVLAEASTPTVTPPPPPPLDDSISTEETFLTLQPLPPSTAEATGASARAPSSSYTDSSAGGELSMSVCLV